MDRQKEVESYSGHAGSRLIGDRRLVVGTLMVFGVHYDRKDSDKGSSPDYAAVSVQLSMKPVHCNWTLTNWDEQGRLDGDD